VRGGSAVEPCGGCRLELQAATKGPGLWVDITAVSYSYSFLVNCGKGGLPMGGRED